MRLTPTTPDGTDSPSNMGVWKCPPLTLNLTPRFKTGLCLLCAQGPGVGDGGMKILRGGLEPFMATSSLPQAQTPLLFLTAGIHKLFL